MAGNRVGGGLIICGTQRALETEGGGGGGRSGQLEMAAPGKRFCETDMRDDGRRDRYREDPGSSTCVKN